MRTDRAEYRARKLVITAGPWAKVLLPQLVGLAEPERQVLLWAQPLRPSYFQFGAFPVFNLEVPEGRFYGLPVYGVPGFKIGKYHHRRERVDPEHVDRQFYPEDEDPTRGDSLILLRSGRLDNVTQDLPVYELSRRALFL